jgi:hypothetical protein
MGRNLSVPASLLIQHLAQTMELEGVPTMTARAHRLHAPMIVYFDAIRRAGSVREAARRLNSILGREPTIAEA